LNHGVFTLDFSVLIYLVDVVFVWYIAWLVRLAVSAHIDGCALDTIVMASGLIDGAGLISHVVVVHEFEGAQGISTMATIIIS
jgi:hypothetical protein